MTESHENLDQVLAPSDHPHLHRGIDGLWTATARLHKCGHIVGNTGHLDLGSRRMVWESGQEQPAGAHAPQEALLLMRYLLDYQIEILNTPPW